MEIAEALEEEIITVFVVYVIGNAERPLTSEEIFKRVMNLSLDERRAIVHHYLQETG